MKVARRPAPWCCLAVLSNVDKVNGLMMWGRNVAGVVAAAWMTIAGATVADPLDDGRFDQADSLLEIDFPVAPQAVRVTVEPGDRLITLMTGAGVERTDAHAMIAALDGLWDPRRMRVGQDLAFTFAGSGDARVATAMELQPSVDRIVRVRRTEEGGFRGEQEQLALTTRPIWARGEITRSLFADAVDAGVPDPVLIVAMRALAYSVDFQRDIREGDGFEFLFDQEFHTDGRFARNGDVLYIAMQLGRRELELFRFENAEGQVDYYNRDGESMRRVLMRTPIEGARLSSSFGPRRHPILGYTRMHRGTDFAAPTGTPIFAAGDGVIEFLGTNSGYGRYIRIRHNGSLKTAYGHMSRYARGLSAGDRVSQGQVIGYVGSSGLSTGPHLHYEVHLDGTQVNPMSIDLPTGETLAGSELAAFQTAVEALDTLRLAMAEGQRSQVANRPMRSATPQ